MSSQPSAKLVIGLVGGIGAGKSTAAKCFEKRGGLVIDADIVGHEVLRRADIIEKAVERWGEGIRKSDGSLDRRAIGKIVFSDPGERKVLEQVVFPLIQERCKQLIQEAKGNPVVKFIVLDAAVMLEAGWNEVTDRIVYVDTPREIRLKRVAARSGWSAEELSSRESAQWPEEMKKKRADAVLMNIAQIEELQLQIDRLLREWKILHE